MNIAIRNRIIDALEKDSNWNHAVLGAIDSMAAELSKDGIRSTVADIRITPGEEDTGIDSITLILTGDYDDYHTRSIDVIFYPNETRYKATHSRKVTALLASDYDTAIDMFLKERIDFVVEVGYTGADTIGWGRLHAALIEIIKEKKNPWAVLGIDDDGEEVI